MPIRTPARKLTATPTPMAGTPMGFRMQTPDNKVSVVDMQPKGNLPLLKPDDMQYFDKLLVSVFCSWLFHKLFHIPLYGQMLFSPAQRNTVLQLQPFS